MSTPQKCFEWSSRGSIFNGFSVNADATSEAILAVSLLEGGCVWNSSQHVGGPADISVNRESRIEFLTLYQEDNGLPQMKSISVLRTSARPVSLQGDLLATSNDLNETTVWNWKASTCAVLVHPFDEGGMIQVRLYRTRTRSPPLISSAARPLHTSDVHLPKHPRGEGAFDPSLSRSSTSKYGR